jgi:hypothetical protein
MHFACVVLLPASLCTASPHGEGTSNHEPSFSSADSLRRPTPDRDLDSTNRLSPSIESMLEEAGEDRLGVSTFLDEIEYYRTHGALSPRSPFNDDRQTDPATPFLRDAFFNRFDSLNAASADEPPGSRQFFPLQADEGGSFLDNMRVAFRSTIEKDLTEAKGFTENKWNGSPVHSVQRLQLSSFPASAGFLLEHDPGETFSNGFIAGYAAAHGVGMIDQAVAGTYTVNAGEGLVLSRASLFSKGTMSITQTKKYGAVLVPYLSRDEFNFFRGAAATLRSGIWSLTGFFSHRRLPATTDASGTVTSFYTSGLFRSETETAKINAVTENTGGLIMTVMPLPTASITLATVAAEYDKSLAASCPYAFGGSTMRSAGLSFNASLAPLAPLAVFGEIAGHSTASLNGVLGTIYRAAPDFSFAVHLRSFSDRYNNPFARAFSERGEVNGERGIYFGIDWNITRALGLFAYVDQFTIDDPLLFNKKGVEYFTRLDGTTLHHVSYSCQLKIKTHSAFTDPDGAGHTIVDDHRRATLRFQLRYTSAGQYTLTQRCNIARTSYAVSDLKEKGIVLGTDIAKLYREIGLSWRAGIVFFDTDSYDSGVSAYEPNVRGSASTSILYGQGIRWFIMADHAISPQMHLSVKYGSLSKWNVTSLGSGDDELPGGSDPQITIQADVSL